MGLCLSKRDVLIQKPPLSLRDQMLNSDLRAAHHHLFIPDSPSASIFSASDTASSMADRHLLKNNSIGSSCTILRSSDVSNAADCGSRSSFGEWRFSTGLRGGRDFPKITPSEDEIDEVSVASTTGPRISAYSSQISSSSPMIEGIDLDNITRSYHKARERFEMEGFSNFRLLEIDEEREEEETGEESPGARKRKSYTRSLHVFGEMSGSSRLVPEIRTNPPSSKVMRSSSSEIGVFGAGDHHRSAKLPTQPVFKQTESEMSCSEVESEQMHVRSARWGFVMDSSGTDEMEGEETEPSRVSSSSTQVESLYRSSPGRGNLSNSSRFMAVPGGGARSEIWPPNFSHMNPGGGRPGGGGFTTMASGGFVLKPMSLDSSSSMSSSSEGSHALKQVHLNLNSNLNGAKNNFNNNNDSEDGNESDTSDDLFEIDSLGAALGSLSSSSSSGGSASSYSTMNKGFVYPMNSAFLRDPDISYSTVKVAPGPGRGFPFNGSNQSHKASFSTGGRILGPTLRANVLASGGVAASKVHRVHAEQPRKVRQMKKRSALENGMFYGR